MLRALEGECARREANSGGACCCEERRRVRRGESWGF